MIHPHQELVKGSEANKDCTQPQHQHIDQVREDDNNQDLMPQTYCQSQDVEDAQLIQHQSHAPNASKSSS